MSASASASAAERRGAAVRGGPDRTGREPARARRGLLGADRRSHGRHGRGPRDRARRAGVVPGQLGGDDGRDDAAGHRADGRRARAHPTGSAGPRDADLRGGLPARVDRRRPRRLRPDRGRALAGARVPRLGPGGALRRGRCHPRRRAVPAHTGQGRVPAPLPRPTRGAQRTRARRQLHRLLLGADGGALRAGRGMEYHRMDGLRGRAHRRRAPAAVEADWPSRPWRCSWWCWGWASRSCRARCPGSRFPTRRTRPG